MKEIDFGCIPSFRYDNIYQTQMDEGLKDAKAHNISLAQASHLEMCLHD